MKNLASIIKKITTKENSIPDMLIELFGTHRSRGRWRSRLLHVSLLRCVLWRSYSLSILGWFMHWWSACSTAFPRNHLQLHVPLNQKVSYSVVGDSWWETTEMLAVHSNLKQKSEVLNIVHQ